MAIGWAGFRETSVSVEVVAKEGQEEAEKELVSWRVGTSLGSIF